MAEQVLCLSHAYGQPTADGSIRSPLLLTQSDLAALVGASRVRVNQVLVAYKQRGFLSVDARYRITVLD